MITTIFDFEQDDYEDMFHDIAATHTMRAHRWHTREDGTVDVWSTADWFTALTGELGEAANVAKKMRRIQGQIGGTKEDYDVLKDRLGHELGDIFHYLVLLAEHEGINLWSYIKKTFNDKSEEMDFPERL